MAQAEKMEILELELPEMSAENKWELFATFPEDEIWIRRRQIAKNKVSFSLKTQEDITWWKAVEIVQCHGDFLMGIAETQDEDHGPRTTSFTIQKENEAGEYIIYLSKAKFLGIHTRMYSRRGLDMFGWHWDIDWRRDA